SVLKDILGGDPLGGRDPESRPFKKEGADPKDPKGTTGGDSEGTMGPKDLTRPRLWGALGEMAQGVTGGGVAEKEGLRPGLPSPPTGGQAPAPATVRRPPRTEFVIFFVWQEQLPPETEGEPPPQG